MNTNTPTSHNIEEVLAQAEHLRDLRIADRARKDLYFLTREVLGYRQMTPNTHAELCATTKGLLPTNPYDESRLSGDEWLSEGIKEDKVAQYPLDDTGHSTPHSTPDEPLADPTSYLNPPSNAPQKILDPNSLSLERLGEAISARKHGVIQKIVDESNLGGKIEANAETSAASIERSEIQPSGSILYSVSARGNSYHFYPDPKGLFLKDDLGFHFVGNESKIPYDPEKKALHIEMPRGTFKSSVVTIGFALQCILNDPNWRVLIDSETYSKAKAFLSEVKGHLENNKKFRDIYFTIYGKYPDDNKRNTSVRWTDSQLDLSCRTKDTKEASFTVSGVDKSINGMHFDLIIGDDLHSETNVTNKEQIEKVKQHYKLLLALLDPGRYLIIIGTRWHHFDMYHHLIKDEEFRFNFYIRKAVNDDGSLLFPERLTKQYLADQRKSLGSYLYSCQYMNTPVDDEDATFKQSYFITRKWELIKDIPINWYMSVDPSWPGKTSDYAAICVAGYDAMSNLYVRYIVREKIKYGELINKIFELFTTLKPKEIVMETIASANSIQYMLSQEMKRRSFQLPIQYISGRNTNKEVRIEGLEPFYKYHRVIHVAECPNREALEDELREFPVGENDDMIDALATILEIARAPRATRDPDDIEKRRKKLNHSTKPRSPLTKV